MSYAWYDTTYGLNRSTKINTYKLNETQYKLQNVGSRIDMQTHAGNGHR